MYASPITCIERDAAYKPCKRTRLEKRDWAAMSKVQRVKRGCPACMRGTLRRGHGVARWMEMPETRSLEIVRLLIDPAL